MPADRQDAPSALIIEDEMLVAMDLEQLLRGMGFAIIGEADRTAKAIEAARSHPPDLILADIRLRGGDNGMDAVEQILAFCRPAVVVVSGSLSELEKHRQAGRFPVVAKPYGHGELADVIAAAMRDRRPPPDGSPGSSRVGAGRP